MKSKKTILSLLLGATLCAGAGVATLDSPNKVDAATQATPDVVFTEVTDVRVHPNFANRSELYLQFWNTAQLKSYLAGGMTEDDSTRLMHFAKQIKYLDAETGETYNFASAGKITTQGITAGDASDVHFLFQKVDENGNVVPFNEGDKLTFPQGMVYETDTNGDVAVDTVWQFPYTFEVDMDMPNSPCANTFGCATQEDGASTFCNATQGIHVYRSRVEKYNIVTMGTFELLSNASAAALRFSNGSTVTNGTVDFGYDCSGDWYRTDADFLQYIKIKGKKASEIPYGWVASFAQPNGMYISSDASGGLNMSVGDTIEIPQDLTYTTSGGATFTTLCKFVLTWNGSQYDVTATYMNGTIPASVGVEPDKTFGNEDSSDDSSIGGGDSSEDSSSTPGGEVIPENRLLANFTAEDTQVYRDNLLGVANEAVQYYNDYDANGNYPRPGTTWDVDYKSTVTYPAASYYTNNGKAVPWYRGNTYNVYGGFVNNANSPDGADGGTYKYYWNERIPGMFYPTITFGFPNDVPYLPDDELEFTIYLSENMDPNFTLWVTSTQTVNVWETQKKFSGSMLNFGDWNTLSIPIKDLVGSNGKIAPIAFIFVYSEMAEAWDTAGDYDDCDNTNDGTPPAEIYFDKVEVRTIEKELASKYKEQDISEVFPMTGAVSYTGEYTGYYDEVFDFSQDTNIKAVRTDIATESVKMNLTISNLNYFDMYFVMNGTGKYYDKGGLLYWLSNEGVNVGYNGKMFETTPLSDLGIQAGVAFELELRAIPYYIEGFKAGYYVAMYVDGMLACESAYVSFADCAVGTWFGFYMHTTTADVTATIEPIHQTMVAPITVTVSALPATEWLDVGDYTELVANVKGNILGAETPVIAIKQCTDVNGNVASNPDDIATITPEDGTYYLDAWDSGIATIYAKVTNQFGTFESERIQIALGDCSLDEDSSSEEDSSEEESSEDDSSEEESSEEISSEEVSSEDSSYEESSSGNSGSGVPGYGYGDIVDVDFNITISNSSAISIVLINTDNSLDLGLGSWAQIDASILAGILIKGQDASTIAGLIVTYIDQQNGLYISSNVAGGLNMGIGDTIVIPQGFSCVTPMGTFSSAFEFTYTFNGTSYDVTKNDGNQDSSGEDSSYEESSEEYSSEEVSSDWWYSSEEESSEEYSSEEDSSDWWYSSEEESSEEYSSEEESSDWWYSSEEGSFDQGSFDWDSEDISFDQGSFDWDSEDISIDISIDLSDWGDYASDLFPSWGEGSFEWWNSSEESTDGASQSDAWEDISDWKPEASFVIKGCGSSITLSVVPVLTLLGVALYIKGRKED